MDVLRLVEGRHELQALQGIFTSYETESIMPLYYITRVL